MHTVVMTTALGEIEVVLDAGRTPVTVSNFLRYMDAGQYNGGRFHRTVTMQNQPNNDVKNRSHSRRCEPQVQRQ